MKLEWYYFIFLADNSKVDQVKISTEFTLIFVKSIIYKNYYELKRLLKTYEIYYGRLVNKWNKNKSQINLYE